MITLAPMKTTDDLGNVQNSFPDSAPVDYVAVIFDGQTYTFYMAGDTIPALPSQ